MILHLLSITFLLKLVSTECGDGDVKVTTKCFSPVVSNANLLGEQEGSVGAANFTFFSIHLSRREQLMDIAILLKTITGDVDLYVHGNGQFPGKELGNHSFKSTACGDDYLTISSSWLQENSPVVIGIHGEFCFILFP